MTFLKHDEPGWHVHEDKRTTATAIRVPSSPATAKVWTVLSIFDDIELGKTHLFDELGGTLPTVRPKNIKTEWRKAGGADPSKRTGREIGTESGWASNGSVGEDVQDADLPLSFVMWQEAGSSTPADVLVTKVIVKAHNPLAEIVGKLT